MPYAASSCMKTLCYHISDSLPACFQYDCITNTYILTFTRWIKLFSKYVYTFFFTYWHRKLSIYINVYMNIFNILWIYEIFNFRMWKFSFRVSCNICACVVVLDINKYRQINLSPGCILRSNYLILQRYEQVFLFSISFHFVQYVSLNT